jgi:hypothetical protein
LAIREVANGEQLELRSRRVFLDPPISDVAVNAITNALDKTNGTGVLTYLVNELRLGDRATPYSMVTALGNVGSLVVRSITETPDSRPISLPELQALAQVNDDDIVINRWLADDLEAKLGDSIELRYYVVGPARKLQEQKASFQVRAILPMHGPSSGP